VPATTEEGGDSGKYNNKLVGLDLGSTKVSAVVAGHPRGGLESSASAAGLKALRKGPSSTHQQHVEVILKVLKMQK